MHYWAVWDLLDRELDQRLVSLREEYRGRIVFRSCDIDREENRPYLSPFVNIPALGCFIGGRWFETVVGLRAENEFRRIFDAWLAEVLESAKTSAPATRWRVFDRPTQSDLDLLALLAALLCLLGVGMLVALHPSR